MEPLLEEEQQKKQWDKWGHADELFKNSQGKWCSRYRGDFNLEEEINKGNFTDHEEIGDKIQGFWDESSHNIKLVVNTNEKDLSEDEKYNYHNYSGTEAQVIKDKKKLK